MYGLEAGRLSFWKYNRMRITLLTVFLMLPIIALAQRQTNSQLGSTYELRYRITLEEATDIVSKGDVSLDKLGLVKRIPYDTLYRDQEEKAPEHGFYLRLGTEEQSLRARLEIVQEYELRYIPDAKLLKFLVLRNGVIQEHPMDIRWKHRRLKYDVSSNVYQLKTGKPQGYITLRDGNREALFPLSPRKDRNKWNRGRRLGGKIIYSFPIRVIWTPFADLYKTISYGEPVGVYHRIWRIFDSNHSRNNAYGYIALNKPKYRPGDTLRYKLKLARGNGKPYRKPLRLEMGFYSDAKFKAKLALEKGQAQGEIVLHDSLNMELDKTYRLALKRGYRQMQSTSFVFEDYVLKSEKYSARLKHDKHSLGTDNMVILSGFDDNKNRLQNAAYELTVSLAKLNPDIKNGSFHVPSVLYTTSGTLLGQEDTEVNLPDSIFPPYDLSYRVKVSFYSESNDLEEQSLQAAYSHTRPELAFALVRDSARISFPAAYPGPKQLKIYGQAPGLDSLLLEQEADTVTFWHNPIFTAYTVLDGDDQLLKQQPLKPSAHGISHRANRTKDSLYFSISNPRQLPVWYSVVKDYHVIEEGFSRGSVDLALKTTHKLPYGVKYKYFWMGNVQHEEVPVQYYDRVLNFSISQKAIVIPGSTDTISVKVTNHLGRPVKGIDVASLAYTSKFQEKNIGSLPYFGTPNSPLFDQKNYNPSFPNSAYKALDYEQWQESFGLDSILYYQITRPQNLQQRTFKRQDGRTTCVVLPLNLGRPQSVYYIKVDGMAKLLSADISPTTDYEFDLKPGFHQIEVRTTHSLITLDSIEIKAAHKNLISFSRKSEDPRLSRTGQRARKGFPLTKTERQWMKDHTLYLQLDSFGPFTVRQNNQVHRGSKVFSISEFGPFEKGDVTVTYDDKIFSTLEECHFKRVVIIN